MTSPLILLALCLSLPTLAFDLKGLVKKVQEDPKTQEQIKEAAKKGLEYFQKNKKGTETKAKTDEKKAI